jgi:hypothetical protein
MMTGTCLYVAILPCSVMFSLQMRENYVTGGKFQRVPMVWQTIMNTAWHKLLPLCAGKGRAWEQGNI